ncbi:Glutamyl-tRNA synthetase @ Glutamyl-tRNA(Gln) synthetase [hydrothermal vent metagenome]|uniref:glutamate--tRNA ligase n=1 Tax=hydrothermal vent metagenome TaxID=652676 RepID=A0A3B0SS54_9ZZZZ
MSVRVRFAPSPTGYLHVGAARTALYNYLFARHNGGVFVLRSDDTDKARSTVEFQDDILEHLEWLGFEWDEGIVVGGPHGTYRQSDRYDRYREVAHGFVREGSAYYSLATSDQLNEFKAKAREAGTSPAYDGTLEPPYEEIAKRLADGETAVIRFRVPRPGETTFTDVVRGDMRFDHAQVDDFVILRSDGTPTYHLASTVDDVDYEITHVIRGEDLLSSTPKHILLTQAMGAEPSTYAHLSLLFGPDGKKLSKRHGDTAMAAYREAGYLPEAMNNYLALLGWNVGDDETIVPLDEMITRFDLSSVSKNPAVFDHKKLEWMNGVYIREMPDDAFASLTLPIVEDAVGRKLDESERDRFARLVPFVKERTKLLPEVGEQARFLFVDIDTYDEKSWSKVMDTPEGPVALDAAIAALVDLDPWTTESIEEALRAMLAEHELSARKGLQPIRVAISGSTVSPPLFESLDILGRPETLLRLHKARSLL